MEWKTLLSTKRMRPGPGNSNGRGLDLRSEFEKDYHRIIGSASFRRLQDKTQVFPLDKSDFIRTRLTHSLEVSSFAKSLGQNIGENILSNKATTGFTPQMREDICHILQCAGLIHDIGNPPFGHFGEEAIRGWFIENLPLLKFKGTYAEELLNTQMKKDFYHFEGNAQALRLVTRLHYLVDENGMNLTYALLNTIVKYPISSLQIDTSTGNVKDKKMGYYFAEQEIYQNIAKETGTQGCRHPLTYILEAADDLAYKTADIEDAFVKGFLSYHELESELERLNIEHPQHNFDAVGQLRKLYDRGCEKQVANPEAYAVKNWIVRAQGVLIGSATSGFSENYNAIMAGTYKHDIFYGTWGEPLMNLLGDIAYRYVFSSKTIYKMELSEDVILNFLMDKLVQAVLYFDTDIPLNAIDQRVVSLISDNYKNAYRKQAEGKSEAEKLYLRLLLVTDYVCGMTDGYAKRLYQELNGFI